MYINKYLKRMLFNKLFSSDEMDLYIDVKLN